MILLLNYVAHLMDTPQSRGTFGEMIVSSIFDPRFFGQEEHYLVNNLLFQTEDTQTHQIDHVLIYKTGIFCIETKNIEGLILGHPQAKTWKVYIGSNPYDMYNPLMQNKKHVCVLSEFLNYYDIHSIVVFIKSNKPKDCGDEVLNIQELKDYIKNYPCESPLSSEQMKEIYNNLTNHKQDNEITNKQHNDNVATLKDK